MIINLSKRFSYPIPELHMTSKFIVFHSKQRHKIKINNAKIMQLEKTVYLKSDTKNFAIHNVDKIYILKDYLYFTALGEVRIIGHFDKIYKYFNIIIKSFRFDLETIKQDAINDLMQNLFNINKAEKVKRYIKIVTEILNIRFTDKGLSIGKNKYNLEYTLLYKKKNQIKKINYSN